MIPLWLHYLLYFAMYFAMYLAMYFVEKYVLNDVLHYIEVIAFKSALPDFGYSAALSWIYFLTVFLIILVVVIVIGRRVFYRGEK